MPQPPSAVVSAVVEGTVDEEVARRLVLDAGGALGAVYGKEGKQGLLQRLPGYNAAARHSRWFVLLDLDADADCVPPARAEWLAEPAPGMCLRVAVREVEAWLLADQQHLAPFLGVAASRLPRDPEQLPDPKAAMVALARRSRQRAIREDMVPRPGSGRAVGPAYAAQLIEFAKTAWDPATAAARSDSLRRCRRRLRELLAIRTNEQPRK